MSPISQKTTPNRATPKTIIGRPMAQAGTALPEVHGRNKDRAQTDAKDEALTPAARVA